MAQLFANNVSMELASDLGAADTHFHTKAGHGVQCPTIAAADANYFLLTIIDKNGNREIVKVIEHEAGTELFTMGASEAVPHSANVNGRAYEAIHGVQTALAITALDNHAIKMNYTAASLQAAIALLAGLTASAAEINVLDDSGVTQADLIKLHAVTASKDELNILDGVTATAAELNLLAAGNRTVGDIITETSAGTMGAIAAAVAGLYFRSAGVGAVPAWHALSLSDTGVKVGMITLTDAAATQAVTGVGFQPSVVIFLAGPATGMDDWSVGFDAGSSQAFSLFSLNGDCGSSSGYSINHYIDSTHYLSAKITTLGADGFTLTKYRGASGGSGHSLLVGYLALP